MSYLGNLKFCLLAISTVEMLKIQSNYDTIRLLTDMHLYRWTLEKI